MKRTNEDTPKTGPRAYSDKPKVPWKQEMHDKMIEYAKVHGKFLTPGGNLLWKKAIHDGEDFAEGRTYQALQTHYKSYRDYDYIDNGEFSRCTPVKKNSTVQKGGRSQGKTGNNNDDDEVPDSPTSKKLRNKKNGTPNTGSKLTSQLFPFTDEEMTTVKHLSPAFKQKLNELFYETQPHTVRDWLRDHNDKEELHCARCHSNYLEGDESETCNRKHIGDPVQIIVKNIGRGTRQKAGEKEVYVFECCGVKCKDSVYCWENKEHTNDPNDVNYESWEDDNEFRLEREKYTSGLPGRSCDKRKCPHNPVPAKKKAKK